MIKLAHARKEWRQLRSLANVQHRDLQSVSPKAQARSAETLLRASRDDDFRTIGQRSPRHF
jgi:hypothetical protein